MFVPTKTYEGTYYANVGKHTGQEVEIGLSGTFFWVILIVYNRSLNKCIYKKGQSEDLLGLARRVRYRRRGRSRARLSGVVSHGGLGIGNC